MLKLIAKIFVNREFMFAIVSLLWVGIGFNIGQRIGMAEGRINEMLKFQLHMMQHMEIERQIFAPAREIEPPVFKDDVH